MDYLFVGDIHSQASPLEKALSYAGSRGLTPVLLGDLFDSRNGKDEETLEVLERVESFPLPMAICQSNHQWKLLRHMRGDIVANTEDTLRTAEILSPYRSKVIRWLESLPFGIILRDTIGREYRVAHACFPSGADTRHPLLLRSNTSRKERDLCLYGPRAEGSRSEWWLHPSERDWIRVAGHYHTVHVGEQSMVLDGSCGDPGGTLVGFDTARWSLVEFPAV